MKYRVEKDMKILDELVGFCYKRGAKEVDVHLDFKEDSTVIIVETTANFLESDLQMLDELIHAKRQPEVEMYYWQVSGEERLGDELLLTGMMIDKAEVSYEHEKLVLKIYRYEGK